MKLNHKQSITGGAIAFLIATSCCWLPVLTIALGGASGMLAFSEKLEKISLPFILVGVFFTGLGLVQYKNKSKMNESELILLSTISCPNCGFQKVEKMPTNACQFFYECQNCQQILKPEKGDCCVYCSYGTVPCPPVQLGKDCCN